MRSMSVQNGMDEVGHGLGHIDVTMSEGATFDKTFDLKVEWKFLHVAVWSRAT